MLGQRRTHSGSIDDRRSIMRAALMIVAAAVLAMLGTAGPAQAAAPADSICPPRGDCGTVVKEAPGRLWWSATEPATGRTYPSRCASRMGRLAGSRTALVAIRLARSTGCGPRLTTTECATGSAAVPGVSRHVSSQRSPAHPLRGVWPGRSRPEHRSRLNDCRDGQGPPLNSRPGTSFWPGCVKSWRQLTPFPT